MNLSLQSAIDATPAPTGFSIVDQADLRHAWAVLSCAGTQWLFRSVATGRWLRLPVSDLDGKTPAEVAEIVEDALDSLHSLPAINPAALSAAASSLKDKS